MELTSYNDKFTQLANDITAAINDEETTVGAEINWNHGALVAGNMRALSTVLADEHGRLWKERSCDDANGRFVSSLVCILDMRPDAETRRVASILDLRKRA